MNRLYDIEIQESDVTIHDKIGRGANGTVYRATYMGKEYALKDSVDYSEAYFIQRMNHPNIVPVIGIVKGATNETNPMILMPLMDGDISELKLNYKEIRQLAMDLVSGFSYMDSIGIYMDDIHMKNILYKKYSDNSNDNDSDSNYEIKFYIGDFGYCRYMNTFEPRQDDFNIDDDPLTYFGHTNNYLYKISFIIMKKMGFNVNGYYDLYRSFLDNNHSPPSEITIEMKDAMENYIKDRISNYPTDMKDFITRTTILDKDKRMSIQAAIYHPFINLDVKFIRSNIPVVVHSSIKGINEVHSYIRENNKSYPYHDENIINIANAYYKSYMDPLIVASSCIDAWRIVKYGDSIDRYTKKNKSSIDTILDIIYSIPVIFM